MKLRNLLIILGIIFIASGTILFITRDEKVPDKKENLLVDTSEKEGTIIENSKYETITSMNKPTEIYFYDYNMEYKNKYIFSIPNNLEETYLNMYGKSYSTDNLEVRGFVYDDVNVDDLIDKLLSSYDENTFNYSIKKNVMKISDYNVSYILVQSIKTEENQTKYEEKYQIYIEIDTNRTVVIDFTAYNLKFSDKVLNDILTKIKVEKNVAKYSKSEIKGDYLVGELKQKNFINNEFYVVSYKVDKNKYEEVESSFNSYDSVLFSDKKQQIDVRLELFYDTINMEKQAEGYIKSFGDKEGYVTTNYTVEEIVIENQNYTRYLIETTNNEGEKINYVSYLRIIDNTFCYIISFESETEIPENIINDFIEYEFNK